MDQIWMAHPDLPDRKVFVTRDQFEIHKLAGWEEIEAPDILRPTSVNVVFGLSVEPPQAPSSTRERFVPDNDKTTRTELLTAPPVAPVTDELGDVVSVDSEPITQPTKPIEATSLPPNLKRDNPHK